MGILPLAPVSQIPRKLMSREVIFLSVKYVFKHGTKKIFVWNGPK